MSDLLDALKALLSGSDSDKTLEALKARLGDEADDELIASVKTALDADGGDELRTALDKLLEEQPEPEPEPAKDLDLSDQAAVTAHIRKLEREKGEALALHGVELPDDMKAADAAKHVAELPDGTYVYTGERKQTGGKRRAAPTKPNTQRRTSIEEPKDTVESLLSEPTMPTGLPKPSSD